MSDNSSQYLWCIGAHLCTRRCSLALSQNGVASLGPEHRASLGPEHWGQPWPRTLGPALADHCSLWVLSFLESSFCYEQICLHFIINLWWIFIYVYSLVGGENPWRNIFSSFVIKIFHLSFTDKYLEIERERETERGGREREEERKRER